MIFNFLIVSRPWPMGKRQQAFQLIEKLKNKHKTPRQRSCIPDDWNLYDEAYREGLPDESESLQGEIILGCYLK
jgi:hypothetical protein